MIQDDIKVSGYDEDELDDVVEDMLEGDIKVPVYDSWLIARPNVFS